MDFISQIGSLFHKGGLVMYPLLLCSIIVIAIVIERWKYYREAEGQQNLVDLLSTQLDSSDWQQATKVCASGKGITAAIIAKALERGLNEQVSLQNALEGSAAVAAARLKDRLNYLETVVTLAPLLGLLGTVVGMINSFSVMSIKTGQPQAITGGVGEALVATAAGLCVAIMALVAHSYFAQWLDRIITDMEAAFTVVIDAAGRRK